MGFDVYKKLNTPCDFKCNEYLQELYPGVPMLGSYDTTRSNIGPDACDFDNVADELARDHANAIYSLEQLNEANVIRREERKLPENLPEPPQPESPLNKVKSAGSSASVTNKDCGCALPLRENFTFNLDESESKTSKYIIYILVAVLILVVIKRISK